VSQLLDRRERWVLRSHDQHDDGSMRLLGGTVPRILLGLASLSVSSERQRDDREREVRDERRQERACP
jgi:hypothetical protein